MDAILMKKTDVVTVGYLDQAFEKFAIKVQAGFADIIERMNTRFAAMDLRFDKIEVRLDSIEERLDHVEGYTAGQDRRIGNLEDKMRVVFTKLKL